jgi:hypothetical protein
MPEIWLSKFLQGLLLISIIFLVTFILMLIWLCCAQPALYQSAFQTLYFSWLGSQWHSLCVSSIFVWFGGWNHTWNHTLNVKYKNLLVLAKIARVQCISTASCEMAFSVQNCIKTKQSNRMLTKNLESVLWVTLEGPIEYYYEIINEATGIWKNNTKFRYLFSHHERYLCGVVAEQEDTNLLWFVHEMEIVVLMIICTNLNISTPQWLQFV